MAERGRVGSARLGSPAARPEGGVGAKGRGSLAHPSARPLRRRPRPGPQEERRASQGPARARRYRRRLVPTRATGGRQGPGRPGSVPLRHATRQGRRRLAPEAPPVLDGRHGEVAVAQGEERVEVVAIPRHRAPRGGRGGRRGKGRRGQGSTPP